MSLCKKKCDKNISILILTKLIFLIQIFFIIRISQISYSMDNIFLTMKSNIDEYLFNFDNKIRDLIYDEKRIVIQELQHLIDNNILL